MAEAEKLKKVQPEGEPIRWSPGARARLPGRAPFVRARAICLRPHARALTAFTCLVCAEIDAAVAKVD